MPCCETTVQGFQCFVVTSQFLILSPGGDKIVPLFGNLFKDELVPKDGYAAVTPVSLRVDVICAVVMCAVCCVLCAVCCVLCAVCCVLCAGRHAVRCGAVFHAVSQLRRAL